MREWKTIRVDCLDTKFAINLSSEFSISIKFKIHSVFPCADKTHSDTLHFFRIRNRHIDKSMCTGSLHFISFYLVFFSFSQLSEYYLTRISSIRIFYAEDFVICSLNWTLVNAVILVRKFLTLWTNSNASNGELIWLIEQSMCRIRNNEPNASWQTSESDDRPKKKKKRKKEEREKKAHRKTEIYRLFMNEMCAKVKYI